MIRFLLISFFLLWILGGCSPRITRGLEPSATTREFINNLYFADVNVDYVYKAKINLYGSFFGGILVIKKTGPAGHRVVFTGELGSKLFDFQYEGDTFTKNFILPEMDKKLIVNLLEDDFRILTMEKATVMEQYESGDLVLYKTEYGNMFNFYFFNKDELEIIMNSSKTKDKVNFNFGFKDEKVAKHITIQHKNIQLTISLDHLNNLNDAD